MSDDQLLEQLTDGELVYLNAQACHAGDCRHPSCHDYRRALDAELYPQCPGTEDNLASHNGHDDPEAHEESGTRAWVDHVLARHDEDGQAVMTTVVVRDKVGPVIYTPAPEPQPIPTNDDPSIPF